MSANEFKVAEAAAPYQPLTSDLRLPTSEIANAISLHGARENNLKNLSLTIPREQFVVLTGLSGSGKSTLAFDILFAEGQRRFLDSMSTYARQFVEQMERPEIDLITGLPPTVAIEQRISRGGGKSTVATVTEVWHFLRLLFAKLGRQYSPDTGNAVEKQTPSAIVTRLRSRLLVRLQSVVDGRLDVTVLPVERLTVDAGLTDLVGGDVERHHPVAVGDHAHARRGVVAVAAAGYFVDAAHALAQFARAAAELHG